MPIQRNILKAGGANGEYVTYTVIYDTSRLTEADAKQLQALASSVMKEQPVVTSISRKIDIFIRGGKAVAIFYYKGNIVLHWHQRVERDFDQVVEQISALLEVFDTPVA